MEQACCKEIQATIDELLREGKDYLDQKQEMIRWTEKARQAMVAYWPEAAQKEETMSAFFRLVTERALAGDMRGAHTHAKDMLETLKRELEERCCKGSD